MRTASLCLLLAGCATTDGAPLVGTEGLNRFLGRGDNQRVTIATRGFAPDEIVDTAQTLLDAVGGTPEWAGFVDETGLGTAAEPVFVAALEAIATADLQRGTTEAFDEDWGVNHYCTTATKVLLRADVWDHCDGDELCLALGLVALQLNHPQPNEFTCVVEAYYNYTDYGYSY